VFSGSVLTILWKTIGQKLTTCRQAYCHKALGGFRSGYPQAVPQLLWIVLPVSQWWMSGMEILHSISGRRFILPAMSLPARSDKERLAMVLAARRLLADREQMMEPIFELNSPRLLMRRWRDDDLPAFAAMCVDPQVMRYFPDTMSRLESAAMIGRVRGHFAELGFGLWALERKDTGAFIGFTGLCVVGFEAHFTPAVEIGWRLAREHWGLGYASEAAWTALGCGFERLGLDEIVSFTAKINLPSQKVMQAIGMQRDPADDFDHPNLPNGDPLKPHVLYRISRQQWLQTLQG
jgi:RimJ/RimL family protein N-acetyltransferase